MRGISEHALDHTTSARRCLLAIAVCTPLVVLILVVNQFALAEPTIRVGLRESVFWALQATLFVGLLIGLALAHWLWPRRDDQRELRGIELLIAMTIGLMHMALMLCVGTYAAGPALVFQGLLAIGLLLFPWRTVLFVAIVIITPMLVYDELVVQGLAPYAPLVNELAFIGGQPQWWWAGWHSIELYLGAGVVVPLAMMLFNRMDEMHAELNRRSATDGLTGLANRRSFMDRLAEELARQRRSGLPLVIVLIDADHFKRINDRHGHIEGDAVLQALADMLSQGVRVPVDLAARLGGEEFALMLPDTTLSAAENVCARLQQRVRDQRYEACGQVFGVCVSMGVVEALGQPADAILRQADLNLYQAKHEGRDRAVCSVLGGPPATDRAVA